MLLVGMVKNCPATWGTIVAQLAELFVLYANV